MNTEKELLQILLQLGYITPQQFQQCQKYQNSAINALFQYKIISTEQIREAQLILQSKTSTPQYNSIEMQSEFSHLQSKTSTPQYNSIEMQSEFSHLQSKTSTPQYNSIEMQSEFSHLQSKDTNENITIESISSHHQEQNSRNDYPQIEQNNDIQRYSIQHKLGAGGMGVVYQAYDMKLKRDIALKVLQEEGSHRKLEQFEQEARLMAKLDHPNIIKVFDFGHMANKNFFTMELVQGKDFASVIQAISLQQSLIILLKSCLAVHYAHGQGVIHRDLKPANIMISLEYEPKVMDFGLARERNQKVSQSMAVEGTPQYMSPEQTTGRLKDIDARSDVYSLGVILYEILTGTVPFKGKGKNNIFVEILNKEAKAPSKIKPSISKELEAICLKCLEKDKNQRYHTAKKLAEDIENYLQNRPIMAKPTGIRQKVWKWSKRNKSLSVVIALTMFTFMMFAMWLWYEEYTRKSELSFIVEQESHVKDIRNDLDKSIENQQQIIKTLNSLEASLANIKSNLFLVKNNMESNNVFTAKDLLHKNTLFSYENGILEIQNKYHNLLEMINRSATKIKSLQEKISNQNIQLEKNRYQKVQEDLQHIQQDFQGLEPAMIGQLQVTAKKLFESLNVKKSIRMETFADLESILDRIRKSILTTTENFYYATSADFYARETKTYQEKRLYRTTISSSFSQKFSFIFADGILFDIEKQKTIFQFTEANKGRVEVAFSPKDNYFVIGNAAGHMEIFNLKTRENIHKKFSEEVSCFRFSANEKYLFFSEGTIPHLLLLKSMEIIKLERFQGVKRGFFSHDEKYLGLCISRDASYFANITPILEIDKLGTNDEIYAKIDCRSYALAFDKANKYLYLGDLKALVVYDLQNKKVYSRIENAHSSSITAIDISFDNNYVVTYGKENFIKVRNTNNFNVILNTRIPGYISKYPFMEYENDDSLSFYAQDKKTTFRRNNRIKKINIDIENIRDFRNKTKSYDIYKTQMQTFTKLFISPDKRYLCSYIIPIITVWDLQENKLVYKTNQEFYENIVHYLDISFDGKYLLFLQNTRLKIVDLHKQEVIFNQDKRREFRKVSRFMPQTLNYLSFERNNGYLDLVFNDIATSQKTIIKLKTVSAIQDISFHLESQKVFVSRAHYLDICDLRTLTVEKSILLDSTQKTFECICAISENTFAGGTSEGEFILFSSEGGILVRFSVYNEIQKIKYDKKEKRFWIFAEDRIFIYSYQEEDIQDFFELLYPVSILEGYNILSADINDDFTKLYVMLSSGIFEIDLSNINFAK